MSVASTVDAERSFAPVQSPYVGLVPYGEGDAEFFFGRSREIAIVAANLRASRLTIVYGPSGVGKSSLLQAGVVHGLRRESLLAPTESPFAVCVVRSWLDDPVRTLEGAARSALEELVGDGALPPPSATLIETLHAWTERSGTLLVVLDQFEEYFQYHAREDDGDELAGFAAELAQVVNDPMLAVNVLLSIREDAWAKLDRFEGHIPLLFTNYLRIDHLDLDAAREAITGPIAAWNRTLTNGAAPYDIEPTLVAAVLDAAAGGLAMTAAETEAPAAASDRIEAPFLQLVLARLWRATVAAGDRVLTLARLEALGGARKIVENHLLEALGRLTPAEQDAASDSFRFLVSSTKTKIAHPAVDLAEWTQRDEAELTPVLDKLCSGESGRILRAVAPALDETQGTSYELFHDVLAEPILAWRRAHEQERARRRLRRRLARIGAVALALIAGFAALAGWAWIEKGHAQTAQARAQTAQAHAERLYRNQLRVLIGLKKSQKHLTTQQQALLLKRRNDAQQATEDNATVRQLENENADLTAEVAQEQKSRSALDAEIASLKAQNQKLERELTRLNTANKQLAAEITRLDRENEQSLEALDALRVEADSLVADGSILQAQARVLAAQLRAAKRVSDDLGGKAAELGYVARIVAPESSQTSRTPVHIAATTANVFGLPAEIDRRDALRTRVADLRRQLARWIARRARLASAEGFFRKANALLLRQRDALRKENASLARTRGALNRRRATLRGRVGAARSEHATLSSRAAARKARNRRTEHSLAARRKAVGALRAKNHGRIEGLASTQESIGQTEGLNSDMSSFLARAVKTLTKAAQDPSLDPALAGLLAVEAFRVPPFDPDDTDHPSVYNALWFALNRLDPKAAADLIAPVAKRPGKIGTTTSTTIKQRICGLVTRGFTPEEWKLYLPPSAQSKYTSASPCRK